MHMSQFYRDISKVEKKIRRVSIRQLKAYFYLFIISVVLVGEVFLLPTWAFYLAAIVTALLLVPYPVLLLLNRWREVRRRIELYFLYEERIYTTNQIRRVAANEFTQDKSVHETDSI
ncbi:PrgI family protein [Enterococcus faecalis]|uniref:Type III secretion system protein PrgI n=2 Tax=Enterococcus faecalis TaxID=1351 RepID=A0A1W6QX99_ENTFL|nr:type III secretion system protein PrgI [Enterococcus faecalis]